MIEPAASGDMIPPECELIEVRVVELRQLFNAIDPSPFHDRELDGKAESFITNWAMEVPRSAPLALLVHLDRSAGMSSEAEILRDAVHAHFRRRSAEARQRLRALLRRGRISLAIGLAFLCLASWLANLVSDANISGDFRDILHESLLIGGWVAMWGPLEVFLYDWWPIRAEARQFDRLASMPVRIKYTSEGKPEAWRSDWPALPSSGSVQGG